MFTFCFIIHVFILLFHCSSHVTYGPSSMYIYIYIYYVYITVDVTWSRSKCIRSCMSQSQQLGSGTICWRPRKRDDQVNRSVADHVSLRFWRWFYIGTRWSFGSYGTLSCRWTCLGSLAMCQTWPLLCANDSILKYIHLTQNVGTNQMCKCSKFQQRGFVQGLYPGHTRRT